MNLEFLEIEHKFVVAASFDFKGFAKKVRALKPQTVTSVRQVKDTYYRTAKGAGHVIRHRYDAELQHLTAKQAKSASSKREKSRNEVREEINILLSQEKGDQSERVKRFLQTLAVKRIGCLYKDIEVFYFKDCEICIYKARAEGRKKLIYCIEFEAKHHKSKVAAREILFSYEEKLGFDKTKPEKLSLFELFFGHL